MTNAGNQNLEPSRVWWIFTLPECRAFVPGLSERHARQLLAATCYRGASVDSWPCVGAQAGPP